jgi:anthranilate synthase/aminodeoxychorismate synthase-like glutamine amidotransferase
MLLLIDNYDSFVFNLARYFERLGQSTLVVRNDAIDVAEIRRLRPDAIVLSPGPSTPSKAGVTLDIVRELHGALPILGICLGHQAIGEALGGKIVRASQPVHGRSCPIHHNNQGVFADLPNPMSGCRYHSLIVERQSLPECLAVTAWTDDGTIMAIEHRDLPVVGIQFHPESILTDCGYPLLAAFLRRAAIELPAELPSMAGELAEPIEPPTALPSQPVTF